MVKRHMGDHALKGKRPSLRFHRHPAPGEKKESTHERKSDSQEKADERGLHCFQTIVNAGRRKGDTIHLGNMPPCRTVGRLSPPSNQLLRNQKSWAQS
jgi:hypothetical protein